MPSTPRQRSAIHPGNQPKSRFWPPRVPHPRVYNFVVSRMRAADNSQRDIPVRVLLLRYRSGDPSSEQLFLDHMPVPRDAWDYDVADRILSWRGAYGGGRLHMAHDGLRATGLIGLDSLGDSCSVQAGSTAIFDCSVALNTGARYKSDGGKVTGLTWDTTSSAWQTANWAANENRLRLTYTYMPPSDPFGDPSFTFGFADHETGASWSADFPGDCLASLKLVTQNGQNVWLLAFLSQGSPPGGSRTPSGPDSVFPFTMEAVEDALATSINGVLVIDKPTPQGALVGLKGLAPSAADSGYYRTSSEAAPFGVFEGGMTIGGRAVPRARLIGSVLHWQALAPEDQRRTGLPERGSAQLQADGSRSGERVRVTRLGAAEALASIAQHRELHPDLHARVVSMQQALSDPTPNGQGLLLMNPFVQDAQGAWGDAVQAAVRQDLSTIMNSCIPSDLWNLLFPGIAPPALTDYLAKVADSAVDGVADPKSFYRSLATAVLTQGMANGSDAFCRNLNGPRAAAWLKTQLSTSPVYNAHGQKLFQHEWQNLFKATADYLADQGPTSPNLAKYAGQIDGQVQSAITDINKYVIEDASSPSLKQDLIKQVQDAGNYAKSQHLYWAFWFYVKNTTPGLLANIAIQMSFDTGSSDGTTLSRAMQQTVAVLTALDPSGFFARQYTDTLNTYLVTNILPSMFGFTGNSSDFDLVKQYLEAFRDTYLTNDDKDIVAAANQIAEILAAENADQILHDSIEALRTAAELAEQIIALPIVADKFVDWFTEAYPRFAGAAKVFGSLLISGVTGLAILNLITEFKEFGKLSPEQRGQLITNALQFGAEIVTAVVKRGVAIRDIMSLNGLTRYERAAAIGKILATGEAEGVLDNALARTGGYFGRFAADNYVRFVGKPDEYYWSEAFLFGEAEAEEKVSLLTTVFGDSLEEFVTTRLGPLFILAGIGFSIYSLGEGEGDLQIANDVLNIVGGSLIVLAMAGEWTIAEGIIAADGLMASIISFAGPLAILAGLAGLGLMIAEMFKKPPDPVQEFVDNYAAPAGFAVSSQSSSIDYAVAYENPDQDKLLMAGFSLSARPGKYLLADADGSIGAGDATFLPDCVWVAQTDGLGMSRIATLLPNKDPRQPAGSMLLSLMDDNTISFQPKAPPPSSQPPAEMTAGAKVVTQTWLSTPRGDAELTSQDGYLAAIPLTLQPVLPDAKGNLGPSQASGWLMQTDQGVSLSATRTDGDTFTLRMSGMAPNYMRMANLFFILDSQPSTTQSYGPSFGMCASTPITYSVAVKDNLSLPAFLSFSEQTGALTPNGSPAGTPYDHSATITATNKSLGSASAVFQITVADGPPNSSSRLWRRSKQRTSGAGTRVGSPPILVV